jgi:hypothetical protein
MFSRRTTQGITILLIYVDEILITGDDVSKTHNLKTTLQ